MRKEIIELQEFEIAAILDWSYVEDNDEYYHEDGELVKGIWDNFEFVEDSLHYASLDDGYHEIRVIVKRLSDGKFFEGFYTIYYDNVEFDNLFLTEVFPIEKTVIVYE